MLADRNYCLCGHHLLAHRFVAQRLLFSLIVLGSWLVGIVWMVPSAAQAGIIINYQIYGETAYDPSDQSYFGWYKKTTEGPNISVGPVNDPAVGDGAAWNLSDNSSALSPIYYYGLRPNDLAQVGQQGWWFHAQAHYLTAFSGGTNIGLQAYFAGKAYKILLDLDPQGDLRATLPGLANPLLLTQGGTGAAAYHTYDLFAAPQSSSVTFRFDGQELVQWQGVNSQAGHEDVVKWGLEGPADQGSMNFREVLLVAGPPPILTGSDYNQDGRVNGADLNLWASHFGAQGGINLGDGDHDSDVDGADFLQWQQELAAVSNSNTLGVVVPEPASYRLLVLMLIVLMLTPNYYDSPITSITQLLR